MTEPANNPVPPPPPPPPPVRGAQPGCPPPPPNVCPEPDTSLREELARARSGNKTLKILAWALLVLFLLALAGGYVVYRKLTAMAEPFVEMFQSFPPPQARPSAGGQAGLYPSTAAASSLNLISAGGAGFAAHENPMAGVDQEKVDQLLSALNKYADRPIVKEFLADMKQNPDLAAAFKSSKGGNPLAVLSYVHNARGMEPIVMKYAMKPEFMALMMEVMSDPEVQPYIRGLKLPANLPLPPAVTAPASRRAPAARRAPAPTVPEEEGEDPAPSLDSEAVSGAPKAERKVYRKAPPPVDSE